MDPGLEYKTDADIFIGTPSFYRVITSLMAGKDKCSIIGVAVGMEFVDGVMNIDTSWTTAVCLEDEQVIAKTQVLTNPADVFDSITEVLQNLLKKINPGMYDYSLKVLFGLLLIF